MYFRTLELYGKKTPDLIITPMCLLGAWNCLETICFIVTSTFLGMLSTRFQGVAVGILVQGCSWCSTQRCTLCRPLEFFCRYTVS